MSSSSTMIEERPAKRAKKQYSCTECFRRKQKCDRTQPCNHCRKRGTEDLCHIPTPSLARPTRSRSRTSVSSDASLPPPPPLSTSPDRKALPARRLVSETRRSAARSRRPDPIAQGAAPIRADRFPAPAEPTDVPTFSNDKDRQLAALHDKVHRLESVLERFIDPGPSHRPSPSLARSPAGRHSRSTSVQRRQRSVSAALGHSDGSDSEQPSMSGLRQDVQGYVDAEVGWLGTSAIESIRNSFGFFLGDGGTSGQSSFAPRALSSVEGAASFSASFSAAAALTRPNGTSLGGIPIPKDDIAAIHRSLPDRQRCQEYVDIFFRRFNWSRYKISEAPARRKIELLYAASAPQGSAAIQQLPFISLLLGILALGSLRSPDFQLVPEESNNFFWASKKCLTACENLAVTNMDSCWTYACHIRYLDLVRAPRTSWHAMGGWIRHAIDLGLHSEHSANSSDRERSEGRVLWSHILQCESEWCLALGRPLSVLPERTSGPCHGDMQDLDFAFREFVLGRKIFIPHLQGIVRFYTTTDRTASREESYKQVLALDQSLVEAAQRLPSYFQFLSGTQPDRSLDRHFEHLAFYRHMFAGMFHFYRILLHRPYFLHWIDERHPQHPYPRSWRLCVESALAEVRMRKTMARELTPDEQTQHYGAAYAAFSSAIILGFGVLLDAGAGHCLCREETKEKIDFIAEVTYANVDLLEARSTDNTANRELSVLSTMCSRMLAFLEPRIAPHVHQARSAVRASCSYAEAVHHIKNVVATLSKRSSADRPQAEGGRSTHVEGGGTVLAAASAVGAEQGTDTSSLDTLAAAAVPNLSQSSNADTTAPDGAASGMTAAAAPTDAVAMPATGMGATTAATAATMAAAMPQQGDTLDDFLLDVRDWNSMLSVLQADAPSHEQPLFADWLHQDPMMF
ncbi:uncharacterized protein PFL1_01540 [Pseudozyma flocculosa PF-1]|uniref:Zn(2)-C6 fungal-type domain-containing protein n=1 Tax=Pseudozyma flocculosa TaxID=84751 RepID=A0A5C3F0Q2_9BASI|nr:uncharacterized protein PFL1_01540 [Pseudozyma flocculosa PF-1]EPQ30639.1 hypothetical protein PFL1_01540 [Pseudozyma flocculosa PF-1]SPO37029.1 uncharacterized protein PSFLO_02501 [Pseudozyma flocculosa]